MSKLVTIQKVFDRLSGRTVFDVTYPPESINAAKGMITALDISYASINPKRIGTIWIDENEYDYRIGIVAVGAELISDNQVYHIKEIKITPLYLAVSDKLPWIRIIIVDYIKDL